MVVRSLNGFGVFWYNVKPASADSRVEDVYPLPYKVTTPVPRRRHRQGVSRYRSGTLLPIVAIGGTKSAERKGMARGILQIHGGRFGRSGSVHQYNRHTPVCIVYVGAGQQLAGTDNIRIYPERPGRMYLKKCLAATYFGALAPAAWLLSAKSLTPPLSADSVNVQYSQALSRPVVSA
jgi:hypothetical protein